MVKLSVVVPIHNVEKYIKKCVDSILVQTLKDIEIILVNDHSQDNSLEICKDYATMDSRIIVIHQDNAGVSSARNQGMKLARGEWITFVDSDDWLDDHFLENFDCGEHQDADIIVQGLKYVDDNTGIVKRQIVQR